MPQPSHAHHGIDYIEFAVLDMDESKRFYADAFGWSFNDYGPDYAGIRKEGGEAGGFRQADSVAAGGPLVILYSRQLDETLAAVRAAGGQHHPGAVRIPRRPPIPLRGPERQRARRLVREVAAQGRAANQSADRSPTQSRSQKTRE